MISFTFHQLQSHFILVGYADMILSSEKNTSKCLSLFSSFPFLEFLLCISAVTFGAILLALEFVEACSVLRILTNLVEGFVVIHDKDLLHCLDCILCDYLCSKLLAFCYPNLQR